MAFAVGERVLVRGSEPCYYGVVAGVARKRRSYVSMPVPDLRPPLKREVWTPFYPIDFEFDNHRGYVPVSLLDPASAEEHYRGIDKESWHTTLISVATGNFSAAGTWQTCNGTFENDSEAANAVVPTSAGASSDSTAVTPGIITIDGIAIKVQNVAGTTGTITLTLRNASLSSDVTSVTLNISDLPSVTSTQGGWVFFKFGSSQTLLAATNYNVRVVRSSGSSSVSLYASSGNNWSVEARTTTTAAPAANDKTIVIGEHTGAGTGNSYTVTMDINASGTTYGPTAAGAFGLEVGKRGTLTWATGATTYLKLAGRFQVCGGGTVNIGTSGTPVGSGITATVEMVPNANVDTGFEIRAGSTVNVYGDSARVTVLTTKLAADAAAAATSLTTVDSTGWLNGDTIALASTTRTYTETESKALTANASGTTLTISAITNAHSGTNNANGDIRGELANLTRNVLIKGTSGSLNTYWNIAATASCTFRYAEFTNNGSSTSSKRGFDVATTTGVFDMQYCSIHDCTSGSSALGVNLATTSSGGVTFSNNTTYNISKSHFTQGDGTVNTTNVYTANGNTMMLSASGNRVVYLASLTSSSSFQNNTVIGAGEVGILILLSNGVTATGTFSGNVVHSCLSSGISVQATYGLTLTNSTIWRCDNNNTFGGLVFSGATANTTVDTLTSFGNNGAGVHIATTSGIITFKSLTLDAGTTLTQTRGIRTTTSNINNAGHIAIFTCENSSFGATNAHTTGDLQIGNNQQLIQAYFYNCLFASTTELANQTNMIPGSFIHSQKHDQVAGSHKTWLSYGTITYDTTIYHTASPSMRLTPNNASNKQESGAFMRGFKVSVANGQTVTVGVWVRKSVAGDGTAYNGNQPRLIVKKNVAAGISADTVLATAAVAAGNWELLLGTTAAVTDDAELTFIVDCDGTTGWVNVDDFCILSPTASPDRGAMKYWGDGLPGEGIRPLLKQPRHRLGVKV